MNPDRIEQLKDDVLGVMEIISHEVAKTKIWGMWQVGRLVLEASEEMGARPRAIIARLIPMLGRGSRWIHYAVQTAEKFPEEDKLPLMGITNFIRTELTEVKRIETPKCSHCKVHKCP